MGVTRREVLALGCAAVFGAAVVKVADALLPNDQLSAADAPPELPTTPRPRSPITFADWRRSRRRPYCIAHRGVGDVVPEHSHQGYQRALDWGAECLEISVVMSRDHELYCLHDLTLDRTTTISGRASTMTAAQIDTARIDIPRLGPGWAGPHRPRVPRLADLLDTIGGRAVVCLEAKDDAAYPYMIKQIEASGVRDSVMIKLDAHSLRLDSAKEAGYPVFAYLGNPQVATAAAITTLAERLDPTRDALVLPADDHGRPFDADLITRAVATGVPVWVFPVHRRSEARHFADLGVAGLITPNVGYLAGTSPQLTGDDWASGRLAAGQLTLDPYADKYGVGWPGSGVIALDVPGRPSFVSLGQLCPVLSSTYRVEFDASFRTLPTTPGQHLSLAFGRGDDSYYEHRIGRGDGYHAVLRTSGIMAVYAHLDGRPEGALLGQSTTGTPLRAGEWTHLSLEVDRQGIRWSRDDGTSVRVEDSRFRGGYLHAGRSGNDGRLELRSMSVV